MVRFARSFWGVFCVFAIASLLSAYSAARAQEARELRGAEVTIAISGGMSPAVLRDGVRDSYTDLPGGSVVTIESETPFQILYIIWDRLPGAWTFDDGGGGKIRDTGFLHEVVILDVESASAEISLGDAGATICEIYAFTTGDLPDWVQVWEPILERADLLVLPTHADDEHLFFGGILPTYAGELGLRVQVAYMTNHWDNRVRPHELLDGLWTVGVRSYPLISEFPDLYASLESLDAAESVYDREKILEFQVELLRRFRPYVVVGHDLNGEYGHGAHILNAMTLREALELSGDAENFPESAEGHGIWNVPKCYLHLYSENRIIIEWDEPLERFDGKTAFDMAVEGFAKHVSQTPYFAVQRGGTWEDCRIFGLLRSTVGADSEGNIDLFENVVIETEDAPEVRLTAEPSPETIPAMTPSPIPEAAPEMADTQMDARNSSEGRIRLVSLTVLAVLLVAIAITAAGRYSRKQKRG